MSGSATEDVTVSTDAARLDLEVIHGFLSRSYWAAGIRREVVERAVRHSLCFGAYEGARQIGFARVVTDRATFAYVSDVFVLPDGRGRGVGKQLMAAIMAHPELQGLRRFTLVTRDAHGLYRQFGFGPPRHPERQMEILMNPYAPGDTSADTLTAGAAR
ncbi:MAG: GNAT family N-acetyltransferase [Candidatus Rokubacteria bacterium]|nr:GNAT family N-acetyltransferase [Candidatus Rokubacteria bacterium]